MARNALALASGCVNVTNHSGTPDAAQRHDEQDDVRVKRNGTEQFFGHGARGLAFPVEFQKRGGQRVQAARDHDGIAHVEQTCHDSRGRAEQALDDRQRKTADVEPGQVQHVKRAAVFFHSARDGVRRQHQRKTAQKAEHDNGAASEASPEKPAND